MNTLEYQILVIINRNHPVDSDDVRIHLDLAFNIQRSKRRVQEVLKRLTEAGCLKRTWKEPCSENRGKWLYNLPEYAEPEIKMPTWDQIKADLLRGAHVMLGKVCPRSKP